MTLGSSVHWTLINHMPILVAIASHVPSSFLEGGAFSAKVLLSVRQNVSSKGKFGLCYQKICEEIHRAIHNCKF